MKIGDHLTLQYRLALAEGRDILNTFNGSPATLTLGEGHMAEPLETLLMDMPIGVKTTVQIAPNTLFGQYRPELRRFFSIHFLQEELGTSLEELQRGDVIEVPLAQVGASGAAVSAMVVALEEDGAWLDLNHPLTTKALIFEAQIHAVL